MEESKINVFPGKVVSHPDMGECTITYVHIGLTPNTEEGKEKLQDAINKEQGIPISSFMESDPSILTF